MGVQVHPRQRRGARELLDQTLVVANGLPGAKRDGYRKWAATPSPNLVKVLGQAGIPLETWLDRVRAYPWYAEAVAGGDEAG